MFATPNYSNAATEAQKKRAREDEGDLGNSSTSFGEHRNKRLQCLPLRTSPNSSRQWPSSITPLNSDSDENLPRSHFSPWSSSPAMGSQPQHGYSEMDMMDSSQQPQMQSGSDGANGRIPTPLQPSFAAQVRGQQCEWAGPGPAVKTLNGVVNMGHHHSGLDEQYIPRTMAAEADWQAVQNNRRLPSPISEGDDCMSNLNSPGMMHGHGYQNQDFINSELSGQPSPPHAMEHPNAMMDVESQCSAHDADNDEEPTTPSPSRRGHIRSRHTVNNWTWQPGMKKSFSIGFRSDCEKCRLKVPGHFNHIIIS
ncbi:Fc.00g043770.m01.CDS01 [Cosmosporella sp. VM-42]